MKGKILLGIGTVGVCTEETGTADGTLLLLCDWSKSHVNHRSNQS